MSNCYYKLFEGGELSRTDLEGFVLAGQVNQRPSDKSVVLDEDSEDTTGTEERSDLRDSSWQWPVQNSLNT